MESRTPSGELKPAPNISVRSVETHSDAIQMAWVRNQVRQFMTHDTHFILPEEQERWFEGTYKPARERHEMVGFLMHDGALPVGYGLISQREGAFWVSGGLIPDARGQGHGERLFSFLTAYTVGLLDHPEVMLDVLETNKPARELYEKIGYVAIEPQEQEGIIVMKYEAPNARS